jgi:hypothetical protein
LSFRAEGEESQLYFSMKKNTQINTDSSPSALNDNEWIATPEYRLAMTVGGVGTRRTELKYAKDKTNHPALRSPLHRRGINSKFTRF